MLRHESTAAAIPPPDGSTRLGKGLVARTDRRPDQTPTHAAANRSDDAGGFAARWLLWGLGAFVACLFVSVVASAGTPPEGVSGSAYVLALVMSVAAWLVAAIPMPLALIASAVCAGSVLKRALGGGGGGGGVGGRGVPPGVAPALGLGALLTVIHGAWWLAGFVGGLHGATATVVAWVIVLGPIVGWVVLARRSARAGEMNPRRDARESADDGVRGGLVVLVAIAAGLGCVMAYAVVPPGYLWASEYGGYDALSYHLPLAQEWYARGWIAPVAHNVYSFLPSYVEGAFVHMAAMAGSPQGVGAGADGPRQVMVGLLAGDGRLVLSTQVLHALMLGIAAWSVAGLVRVVVRRMGGARGGVNVACVVAAIATITTPWMVVTGTLAYNEAAVVAMLAAALACALARDVGPWARGALCGVLTGFACCVKPSALVLGAPMVGIAMLAGCWDAVRGAHYACIRQIVTRRLGMCVGGCVGGCVGVCLLTGAMTLAPWLVRNAVVSGNPVFPFAANVLGHGEWTKEQAARYAAAHAPDRGVIGAMALMVAPDARVSLDGPTVQRFRGATNPQWLPLLPLGAVGLIVLIAVRRTRWMGLVFAAGVVAVWVAWGAMTHAQSRFLVVLVPIAAASVGGAAAALLARVDDAKRARVLGVGVVAGFVVMTAVVWMTRGPVAQVARQGALVATFGGPHAMTVVGLAEELQAVTRDGAGVDGGRRVAEIVQRAAPTAYVGLLPGMDVSRVLMIGGATPLYAGPVAYRTAWDTWPILEAMRAHPDAPAEWTRALRDAGFDYAIVDLAEVTRLAESGYLDPMLTPERIGAWMRDHTGLVRGWAERGVFVVDLRGGSRTGSAGGGGA